MKQQGSANVTNQLDILKHKGLYFYTFINWDILVNALKARSFGHMVYL